MEKVTQRELIANIYYEDGQLEWLSLDKGLRYKYKGRDMVCKTTSLTTISKIIAIAVMKNRTILTNIDKDCKCKLFQDLYCEKANK